MIIPRGVLKSIERELEHAYPDEGCGLLVGEASRGVRVRRHRAVHNQRRGDRSAATRYLIAPEEFQVASRTAEAKGLEIVGVYHSHPDVAPRPSEYDRDHAWPWYHYLIVSVCEGAARGMRVWQLADDRRRFVERAVCIVE